MNLCNLLDQLSRWLSPWDLYYLHLCCQLAQSNRLIQLDHLQGQWDQWHPLMLLAQLDQYYQLGPDIRLDLTYQLDR